jgi:hypothetical protein
VSRACRRSLPADGETPGGKQQRYPGFDVLDQADTWDAATAAVVLSRLTVPPALRFFAVTEEGVGRALFSQLLDQRDDPRVPVLEMVDARLADSQTDGWRFADLPEDGEAFRASFAALDADAQDAYGEAFAELDWYDQADLVQAVQQGAGPDWHGMNGGHIWGMWTRYACTAFYSHPWAWNEIGFGGPAYPRGYKHAGINAREPWEVEDRTDHDPVGRGGEVEHARREHARTRTEQLKSADPDGPAGVGNRLARDSEHR